MPDQLYIIDAIGPFFRGYEQRTINWSKIPFAYLATADEARWAQIREDLRTFAQKVSPIGYNAVSLDDVVHLVDDPTYSPELQERIASYRREFTRCFDIMAEHGLAVYLTMDYFTVATELTADIADKAGHVAAQLDHFLTDFPQVAGVIVRIGESDGRDVHDDFRSQLAIQTPAQANAMLKRLLPVFEKHARRLVFRTWTVGAYSIGDLMWHRDTFADVLEGLDSPALIVSMKYGESDFFRYLPLNKNFFRTPVAKIIELQTRREYEGCGEYPSFVGWEYDRYLRELQQAPNVLGCMVWCQTGGWVPFRRLAFIDGTALWTELNTYVTLKLMRQEATVEQAVLDYAHQIGLADGTALLTLLRLSEQVILQLLYMEEFAQQKLFFRRVRIPPSLQVYWHNMFISHAVRKVLRFFVSDHEACMADGYRALDNLSQMKTLAATAGLPVADIEFMEDTFQLLALAREYVFSDATEELQLRIRAAKKAYKAKYPKGGSRYRYRIKLDFTPLLLQPRHLRWGVALLFRRKRGYRVMDRLLTLHLLSLVYRIVAKRRPHWIPSFARESAMGIDTIFR
jgi:hypothetical protein